MNLLERLVAITLLAAAGVTVVLNSAQITSQAPEVTRYAAISPSSAHASAAASQAQPDSMVMMGGSPTMAGEWNKPHRPLSGIQGKTVFSATFPAEVRVAFRA
jgi:hypothetical protein